MPPNLETLPAGAALIQIFNYSITYECKCNILCLDAVLFFRASTRANTPPHPILHTLGFILLPGADDETKIGEKWAHVC